MHKFFNACLVLAVLVSAFFLYSLEHSTRGLERNIAKLQARHFGRARVDQGAWRRMEQSHAA